MTARNTHEGASVLPGYRCESKATVTLANSLTETTIFPSSANSIGSALRAKVPANRFQVGDRIRIRAGGIINTKASTPGTLAFKVKHDSTAFATGTATPNITASLQAASFIIDVELEIRSIGAGGTVNVIGTFECVDPIQGLDSKAKWPIIAAAAALDTTAEWVLDCTLTWGTADADNNWTIYFSDVWFIDVEAD